MLKKAMRRGLLGMPIGVTIGVLMLIIGCAIFGEGKFSAGDPELVAEVGSELGAFSLQIAVSAVMGFGFSAGSVVWSREDWGLTKQTGIYFLVCCVCMLPAAYFLHWMPHTVKGFLAYFGIFVAIFIVVWLVTYLSMKHNVEKMNEKLKRS